VEAQLVMRIFRMVSAVGAVSIVAYTFNQAGLWFGLLAAVAFVVAAAIGHMSVRRA
jgi:hypothetical protein